MNGGGARAPVVLAAAGLAAVAALAVREVGAAARAGLEADVDLSDGPGAPTVSYQLRGTTLIVLQTWAEDGAPAGLYRGAVRADDPLRAALVRLPSTVAGAPPRPDTPVARFVVRANAGNERTLVAPRPPSDPVVARLLTDLDRRQAAMRATPLLAIKLEVRPAAGDNVTVGLTAEGASGGEARIDPNALLVELAAEPARAAPGVTPLPPEWQIVSGPPAETAPRTLRPGAAIDVALPVTLPPGTPGARTFIRAVMDGVVALNAPGATYEPRMYLTSKAIPAPAGKKK